MYIAAEATSELVVEASRYSIIESIVLYSKHQCCVLALERTLNFSDRGTTLEKNFI